MGRAVIQTLHRKFLAIPKYPGPLSMRMINMLVKKRQIRMKFSAHEQVDSGTYMMRLQPFVRFFLLPWQINILNHLVIVDSADDVFGNANEA